MVDAVFADKLFAADDRPGRCPSWKGVDRKRGRRRMQPRQMAKTIAGFERCGVRFTKEAAGSQPE